MKKILFRTNDGYEPLVLRLLLGIVLLAHGSQKLLGWFGGYGFKGTMEFFRGTVGLPWIVGFLVILLEFFGSLLLILGLGTRIWATSIFFMLAGIAYTSHLPNGFFMNWSGNQAGEGYEYFLLAMSMAASLAISGGGRLSVDRLVVNRRNGAHT